MPANHVLEVFEGLEIFLDDRADSLDRWCQKHFAFLAPSIRAELDTWIGLLRQGTSRRRPRARSTVVTLLRLVLPFLTEYGGKWPWQDFREVGVCSRALVTLRHG
ncbi:hypothetical protein [Streptomyces sp. NPDC056468]|uniref:hypothetical protein n=1 Tax=Streptomyces sp. NPDC056468 TaxID=3345830 RepID=UPI0036A0E957